MCVFICFTNLISKHILNASLPKSIIYFRFNYGTRDLKHSKHSATIMYCKLSIVCYIVTFYFDKDKIDFGLNELKG